MTIAPALRRLYFVRSAFALVWAVLLFLTVADLRSSRSAGLYLNIAISSLAAVGLAIACSAGIPAVLRVWGAWAIVSGLVQLIVGVSRRRMGGQWPMILSGGISTLAGTSFILQAAADGASLRSLAGYALLGGIFFLTSAVRLGRAAVRV
jgi:uncharacterized membrane protein HdeD (DUF308 family)